MSINFTWQDIFGTLYATILFPIVLVIPGFVIGWILDIFSFKKRTLVAQYIIAACLSNAIVPIILYLAFRFFSNKFAISLIIIFFIFWLAIQFNLISTQQLQVQISQTAIYALMIAGIWILFCTLLLVDIQIGNKLYFNAGAHDFTTRASLIEAITRTGVPPVNPSYYPGHYEKITELYYFWYIPASAADILGGNIVDARLALFAGITWSGLTLMATIAVYLRLRNARNKTKPWQAASIGIQLLLISGLDFIPVISIMIATKTSSGSLPFDGRIEGWNMPITSWLNALTWVPNHVAGVAACITAVLTIIAIQQEHQKKRFQHVLIAGLAIASALGLSTWVAVIFGVFLLIWVGSLMTKRINYQAVFSIIAAGTLGLIFASQFLLGILQSGGKSEATGNFPIGIYIRPFTFITEILPSGIQDIAGILLLPINYFFELGFFFIVAIIWINKFRKSGHQHQDVFFHAEFYLLISVVILMSFVKSTIISLNDFGMRGWLLGQFILIIWSVDLITALTKEKSLLNFILGKDTSMPKQVKDLITILAIVGMMTTGLEAISTRFWTILIDAGIAGVPNELTPDVNLGERTFYARLTYDFIRDNTPTDYIIQNNPNDWLDRPSGLYGNRQMVISDRTAYGIPIEDFEKMATAIGEVFLTQDFYNWSTIDKVCADYSIQAIVVKDTDPLWQSLPNLKTFRTPLYANKYYAVFSCND
jgi:hypothetical protein